MRSDPRTYPLDLDIGEVADGYHLIARSISLEGEQLFFVFAFVPERAEGAEVWLNMSYGADIPVSQDYTGCGDEVMYARPPRGARYAWFDFFRPDYDWTVHVDWGGSGQPDRDYLRNRIARLIFDLKTGEAVIDKLAVARPLRTTANELSTQDTRITTIGKHAGQRLLEACERAPRWSRRRTGPPTRLSAPISAYVLEQSVPPCPREKRRMGSSVAMLVFWSSGECMAGFSSPKLSRLVP